MGKCEVYSHDMYIHDSSYPNATHIFPPALPLRDYNYSNFPVFYNKKTKSFFTWWTQNILSKQAL